MSLFQCEACGCRENTATCNYWLRDEDDSACKGKKLCSACDPDIGEWHGQFTRVFLPMGMFETNSRGNLGHKETGDENVHAYAIEPEAP
jgi:hypothetical protein